MKGDSVPMETVERNLGPQPVGDVLAGLSLSSHDLVAAAPGSGITHKMVARAIKGRRLTRHSQEIVRRAIAAASGRDIRIGDLFNY